NFHTGDHLTYRYTIQRQVKSEDAQSTTETRFETHVLVAGENSGLLDLGFQRNRQSAELTHYEVKGKDRLEKEQPGFLKRMQSRPSHFSEAMEVSLTGEPRYPWEMARETPSHVINVLHEVMSIPSSTVKQGEVWRSGGMLGLEFRWTGDESIHGKNCH